MFEQKLMLAAAPRQLARVLKLPVIARHATRRPRRRLVRSFYYDTPDRDLRRQGLELRIRKSGGRWFQTVKSRAGRLPGLHARAETVTPLRGPTPDLDALAREPAAEAILSAEVRDRLGRVFETRFWRRQVPVRFPQGTLIEVSADTGGVYCGASSVPICEIELELKRGAPESLYALARQISESVPVSLNLLARADLGYRLVEGSPPAPVEATVPELSSDQSTEDGLAGILTACLEQALGNEEIVLDGDDIEGVHQMRVALRRLRSCLAMFRRLLPHQISDRVRQGLKPLLEVLGPARDWDVFLTEQGGAMMAALPDQTHLRELFDAARRRQTEAYATLRTTLRSAGCRRQQVDFSAWVACREWRTAMSPEDLERIQLPLGGVMGAMLQHGHKRVLHWGRKIKQRSLSDLHRLRIAVKRQRYAVEFFSRCHSKKKVRGYLRALRHLQEELGRLNDGATARRLLGQLKDVPGLRETIQFVEGWNACGGENLKRRLPPVWKEFRDEKPFWKKPAKVVRPLEPLGVEAVD